MRIARSLRELGYTRAAPSHNPDEITVDYCHQHNLVDPAVAGRERNFGIRVTLPANDTLRKVLGNDWEQLHWYATEDERDAAFEQMAIRHGYYRKTDTPTQVLEKVTR